MTAISRSAHLSFLYLLFARLTCRSQPSAADDLGLQARHQCQPIDIELCRGIGYNLTSMPNLVHIDSQQDAEMQLDTYKPLIKVHCSSQLKFFLCAVHVPMCTDKVPQPIGPCRPLCDEVRSRCQPMLAQFGFQWPESLNCSQFPLENSPLTMCMKGPGESGDTTDSANSLLSRSDAEREGDGGHPDKPERRPPHALGAHRCKQYKHFESFAFINSSKTCTARCDREVLFPEPQRQTAAIWISCLSGLCIIFTAAALCVVISSNRLLYPEKPFVFIALCYCLLSVGYMIRFFSGREATACTLYASYPVLVTAGLQNIRCTVIFIFIYYFDLVAIIWWFILCATWCLAVGPRWTSAEIEKHSSFYHAPAWAIPAILTIFVLVRQSVDADELTGICAVGFQNSNELLYFVILPHLVCMVLGMASLTVGFATSLFCVGLHSSHHKLLPGDDRDALSSSAQTTSQVSAAADVDNSNRNLKLGVMATFYVVPCTCLLSAYFYEYMHRDSWLLATSTSQPSFETFILKIFANIIFGMISAIWIIYARISQTRGNEPSLVKQAATGAAANANNSPFAHQFPGSVGSDMLFSSGAGNSKSLKKQQQQTLLKQQPQCLSNDYNHSIV